MVVETEARIEDRTGVEMEALTAAAVALLTIYDMCKAVDRGMVISEPASSREAGRGERQLRSDPRSLIARCLATLDRFFH